MSLGVLKEREFVGIIGTAGRGTDGNKLSKEVYDRMNGIITEIIGTSDVLLVSGGAAWSDHLAVRQYLHAKTKHGLVLHLPCAFGLNTYTETSVYNGMNVGTISNHYHELFSKKAKIDSLKEIGTAIRTGANVQIGKGFFDRNNQIARVDKLIAFTYGDGPKLKDGGTAHTTKAYLANGGQDLYHVNLNDFTIYKLNRWPG